MWSRVERVNAEVPVCPRTQGVALPPVSIIKAVVFNTHRMAYNLISDRKTNCDPERGMNNTRIICRYSIGKASD